MVPALDYAQANDEVAGLFHGAGERLLAAHDLLRQRRLAALDLLLQGEAAAPVPDHSGVLLPSELLIRAQWACSARAHTSTARRYLESVVAAFAAVVCALEVLDEPANGDEPATDGRASDLALALLGESIELVRGLPEPLGPRLLAHWAALWTRCAAARTLDAALATWPDLTVSQAIRVATTSGLVTQWAAEAGAIIADAAPGLVAPLADFGRSLGTAHKLRYDLHALSPAAQRRGKPAPAVPCNSGPVPTEPDPGALAGDVLRRRLVECGALDYTWACADQCRGHAADALRLFAGAGGDPTPLAGLLDLPPALRVVQLEDAQP